MIGSAPPAVLSETELQQYLGTAWSTARLLGATFSPECWIDLAANLRASLTSTPPKGDGLASATVPQERSAIVHARLVRLVELMFEEAVRQTPPGGAVVVLEQWTLQNTLKLKLCLWPFWLTGC